MFTQFIQNYEIQNIAFSAWSLHLFAGLSIYTIRTGFARLCDVISTLFAIEIYVALCLELYEVWYFMVSEIWRILYMIPNLFIVLWL